jgi:hypothetical protein
MIEIEAPSLQNFGYNLDPFPYPTENEHYVIYRLEECKILKRFSQGNGLNE